MGQLIPITLPADGNWPTIVGDSIMIIGPRQNELTEEQRYFNPIYLMVYPGKEHLKAQMIRAGACDCDLTKPNRRIGVFSVAPDKQVSFSQGNLQYLPAINLWKFADTQYEYLGNANKYLKPTFRNWVDLFGWSANNTTAPFGVSTSMSAADYAGDFVDWGTNTICGDAPGTWRTLSVDEWDYLFKKRTNAAKLYSKGSIEGTRGMIVLPDNWALPEGVQFTVDTANLTMDLDLNAYSYAEWQRMEEAGAVFLCVTGRRDGKEVGYLQEYGGYWSSTTTSITTYHWFFNYIREVLTLYDNSNRVQGRAVRLVHDTIVPPPAPCETFKVNSVTFNMMCVEGGTFMMGATENDTDAENDEYPQHQVTVSDFMIGQTEVTQELWTAVMGTNPSKNQGNYLPVEQVTWDECQEFVAKLNQLTGKHFRLPTEAEWEFAARGGNKSKGYKYSGSDNLSDVAWYEGNSAGKTHNVGTKLPNELGIFDMSGNVYEKCQDWYAPYTAEAQVNPQGPAEPQTHRVVRGGCSGSQATNNSERVCRVINRGYARTTSRESITGLRLVLDTAEYIPAPEPAKRIGVFSVAADKQVSFSQGNLQYIQSTDTWQFAANQLEYMGHKHYRNGQLADTIEYFGWSGKDSKTPWGISLSTESSDYEGEFLDWGTNSIAGSAPNTWRTLSNDEWLYICQGRKNADQLLGLGIIGTVTGLIILPDDWQLPAGLSFTPNTDDAAKNQYTYEQWDKMENAGAVFIATSGYFNPKLGGMRHVGGEGHIRTNALSDNGLQVYSVIKTNKIIYSYSGTQEQNLQDASAQRLVHDTIVPETISEPCLVVKVNDTLSINMMCVEGGTFMMGQGEDAHPVSLSSYSIGQTEVTQALWEAVMGTNPSANTANKQLPVIKISWYDCQEFIKKLNQQTGMRFRLPTEAEWEYAARGGQRSKGYTYAGSNDIDQVGWYNGNSSNKTHAVGQKQPNELGIYDMTGNAWEWCEDYYDTDETMHVVKSGSFYDYESACRIDSRTGRAADYKSFIGLRLVLDERSTPPEPEYVDLGLSVKWATFNVGATSPEDYGDYFAWGETEPKETYSWATYKWCEGTSTNMTKYNAEDGKTILEPADDAAQVYWGEKWRMPSKEEVDELTQQCNWIWTTHNNVNGYIVTGPNGNSIFLPAAGYKGSGPTYPEGEDGLYWTNTIEKQHYSYLIVLHDDAPPTQAGRQGTRCFGFTIRPVYDEVPAPCLVVKVNDTLSINLMCVEGGTFMMGSDAPDAQADEQPVHEVTLSDYYIGQTEVTQHLWKAVMGSGNNPSAVKGNNLPVTNITWDEAQVFVERLSELTGMRFRLPTEAEWEYAARGGQKSKGYTYAGSNDIDQVGWYNGNSSNKTHAVGQKQPNELGIYDMTGNVWEYCSDWHMPYAAQAQTNPTGAATGDKHVLRGGCYHYDSKNCTNTNRHSYYTPDKGGASTGLRIVLEP